MHFKMQTQNWDEIILSMFMSSQWKIH